MDLLACFWPSEVSMGSEGSFVPTSFPPILLSHVKGISTSPNFLSFFKFQPLLSFP